MIVSKNLKKSSYIVLEISKTSGVLNFSCFNTSNWSWTFSALLIYSWISSLLHWSLNDLEQLSKIKYSYEPYIDNKNLVGDYLSATIVLQECNIPVDSIKTAMSIYVYDTGSDVTLAQYTDTNLL